MKERVRDEYMTSKALEGENGQQNREHPSNSIFFLMAKEDTWGKVDK